MKEKIKRFLILLKRMNSSSPPEVDRRALATALSLVFGAGLRKKEITALSSSDLSAQNGRPIGIALDDGVLLELSGWPQGVLKRHLDNLFPKEDYLTSPGSPLFPEYHGSKGERKMSRDLDQVSYGLTVREVHKLGVNFRYRSFMRKGVAHKKAVQLTAKLFRITPRQTKDLLAGRIQRAGRRKPNDTDLRCLELHDKVAVLGNSTPSVLEKAALVKIEHDNIVDSDPGWSDEEKTTWKTQFLHDLIGKGICFNPRSRAWSVSFTTQPKTPEINPEDPLASILARRSQRKALS